MTPVASLRTGIAIATRLVGPSMTYWVRGEPDPRSDATDALVEPLQARVRDPLWFLTRQWQLGEFEGADSGSPAYVALTERTGRLSAWAAGTGPSTALGSAPLEPQTERESFTPDLATRVELGQTFEHLLTEQGQAALIDAFRLAYPIDSVPTDPLDRAEAQWRSVVGGRAIDGLALAQAAAAAAPALPPAPAVSGGPAQGAVLAALAALQSWIANTIGTVGVADPVAWTPPRLEYALTITGTSPVGQSIALVATPGADGLMDWPSLDLGGTTTLVPPQGVAQGVAAQGAPSARARAIIPAHVRFRGAPNARFWDFEAAGTDLGSIIPDKRDLAKLAVMDFVMLHSNDWFVVPIDMAPGDLHQFDQVLVHDVFGVQTLIERADREAGSAGLWSMFTTSVAGQPPSATADFFVLSPSAASAIQLGTVLETVEFARDDIANMVWAIEQSTENAIGAPWPGHERDMAHNVPAPGAVVPPPELSGVALRYNIQSRVPENWIPFLPVTLDPGAASVALERAAMLRDDGTPIEPAGRILRPSSIASGSPYRIPEEEVAPTGVTVQRVVARCRWVDGSTTLWVMRQQGPGTGSVNSALRFDEALPTG
jgi:hypothetical protein